MDSDRLKATLDACSYMRVFIRMGTFAHKSVLLVFMKYILCFFVYIHIFTMLCRLVLMVMRELFVFFSSSIQEAYHLVWDASIHPQRAGCFELGFSFGTRVSWMS